jgi:thymidylate synthase
MSESVDAAYAALIRDCLDHGERIETRNSRVFRAASERLITFTSTPLVAARKTAWRNALREMEWFLSGSDSINTLHPSVRHWWRPWADATGRVANNYSKQFRRFAGNFDQIAYLIEGVRHHPYSRRNVITTWHTKDMAAPETPITNCHGSLLSARVGTGNRLHLSMVQRSADVVCGLPANWIQYFALLLWLARRTGREVGSLTWHGLDNHVYETHHDLARRVIDAAPRCGPTPTLLYHGTPDAEFKADDFALGGMYEPVVTDRAEMVV